jgi:ADP-heptose:LPS heptosyltransferase
MLAAALARCSLFLGHDSGPAHVAAAVDCPCVLVFGPTDPAMWAPPGEHVRVVCRGDSTIDVGIDDVLRAVAPALAASGGSQIQTSSPFSPG